MVGERARGAQHVLDRLHIMQKMSKVIDAVRVYRRREGFRLLWDCSSPTRARKFLACWCRRAMRSRLKPMQKVAKMLMKHRP